MHDGKPKIVISLLLLAASLAFAAPVKIFLSAHGRAPQTSPSFLRRAVRGNRPGTFQSRRHIFSSQGCQQTRSRQNLSCSTVRRTLRVPRASVMPRVLTGFASRAAPIQSSRQKPAMKKMVASEDPRLQKFGDTFYLTYTGL